MSGLERGRSGRWWSGGTRVWNGWPGCWYVAFCFYFLCGWLCGRVRERGVKGGSSGWEGGHDGRERRNLRGQREEG